MIERYAPAFRDTEITAPDECFSVHRAVPLNNFWLLIRCPHTEQ